MSREHTIEIVKWLKEKKMRTKVISLTHDSIIIDVHKDELQDFLAKMKQLLIVEAEMSEENWWSKKEIDI